MTTAALTRPTAPQATSATAMAGQIPIEPVRSATRMPPRVALAATDRSIAPVRITVVPASARSARNAPCRMMFWADASVRKFGRMMLKKANRTTSAMTGKTERVFFHTAFSMPPPGDPCPRAAQCCGIDE